MFVNSRRKIMFFSRLIVKVCRTLPLRGRFGLSLLLFLNYGAHLERVKEWHKAELKELDPVFWAQLASLRVISARGRVLALDSAKNADVLNFNLLARRVKLRIVSK